MRIHKIEDCRWSINRVIFEWSTSKDMRTIGFMLRFDDWEIVTSIGFVFGRLWISTPHHFLYKTFPKVFHGKRFGEWGREIGFMVTTKYIEYSLWWYSDINKPRDTWRTNYISLGRMLT